MAMSKRIDVSLAFSSTLDLTVENSCAYVAKKILYFAQIFALLLLCHQNFIVQAFRLWATVHVSRTRQLFEHIKGLHSSQGTFQGVALVFSSAIVNLGP